MDTAAFERDEWLGDAILHALVAIYVARQWHPDETFAQGAQDMTRMTTDAALSRIASTHRLVDPRRSPPFGSSLGDVVEAQVGQSYRLSGLVAAAERATWLLDVDLSDGLHPGVLVRRDGQPAEYDLRKRTWEAAALYHHYDLVGPLSMCDLPTQRMYAWCGDGICKAAHSVRLFSELPNANEHRLTRARVRDYSSVQARRLIGGPGPLAMDALQVLAGATAIRDGLPRGMDAAALLWRAPTTSS